MKTSISDTALRVIVEELFEYREDGHLYNKFTRGSRSVAGKRAGAVLENGSIQVNMPQGRWFENRLVFLLHHGYMPAKVRHHNRIADDNRIENLWGDSRVPQVKVAKLEPVREHLRPSDREVLKAQTLSLWSRITGMCA